MFAVPFSCRDNPIDVRDLKHVHIPYYFFFSTRVKLCRFFYINLYSVGSLLYCMGLCLLFAKAACWWPKLCKCWCAVEPYSKWLNPTHSLTQSRYSIMILKLTSSVVMWYVVSVGSSQSIIQSNSNQTTISETTQDQLFPDTVRHWHWFCCLTFLLQNIEVGLS